MCHPSRLVHKQHLLTQLRNQLKSLTTDPTLKMILLEGINYLLTGHSPSFPTNTSPYHHLVQTQSTIGWDNLLRGFLSKEWSRLHTIYIVNHPHSSTDPSKNPFLALLNTIIGEIHSIWKFRSAQRHSKDVAIHENERLRQTNQQITDLYQLKSLVLPTNQSVFKSTLQDHLTDNLSALTAWIHNHAQYIHQSCKHAQQLQVSHTIPITKYFTSI